MADKEPVSRDEVFSSIVHQAASLYKLVLSVATAFLGGTLVFIDKIAPQPSRFSVWFLYLGWLCLIVCILLIARVHWLNLESGRHALEGNYEQARRVDRTNRMTTFRSIVVLAIGLFFIMLFGALNINKPSHQENPLMETNNQNRDVGSESKGESKRLSIPYASTGPVEDSSGDASNDSGTDSAPSQSDNATSSNANNTQKD